MEKIITYDNLRYFAYVNDKICEMPIKGIVISFFGLNGLAMFSEDPFEGKYYAEKGILYVVPYNNPWAWQNKQSVGYTDEIIDVLADKYNLNDNIPIVSTGGSMGGLAALTYMCYAKRTPIACCANCPVCDLPYHYTERPDLPRTLYSAFYNYDMTLDKALESASPYHLAEKMPVADYFIYHCDADKLVNKEMHSDRFVELLSKSRNVEYHVINGRGHCDLTEDMHEHFRASAVSSIFKNL